MRYNKTLLGSLTLALSASVMGHGLMSDPAARNWLCGATTKPDTAEPGSVCAQAFEDDFEGGYQFMSVLTHDVGRAGVTPLPDNVCGFDSETWSGGATPWDKPLDWPTNPMSAGEQTITWNISWGPHFGDTEEFRYWITKPGFEYQVGEPLSWDDFEQEAFCVLNYDDANPNANPDVVPDKDNSLFHTTCDVPERSGRHVIYGEWGRNEFTYERFHGCIDAQFDGDGGGGVPVVADIVATPDVTSFTGAGEIAFDGSTSQGEDLAYQWSLEAADTAGYSLSSTSGSSTVLSLPDIEAQQTLTVRLQVTGAEATSSTSVEIAHAPDGGASWQDLGALTGEAQTLSEGDEVSVRLVEADGTDVYLPAQALVIDSATTAADAWPYALAQAVNAEGGDVRVGVLADGSVSAAQSATDNRVYTSAPDSYTSAFLDVTESGSSSSAGGGAQECNWYGTIEPVCENSDNGWGYENGESCVGATACADQPDPYGLVDGDGSSSSVSSSSSSSEASSSSSSAPSGGGQASCEHSVENEWGSGFTASVSITNDGDAAINSWEVEWGYSDDVSITNSWNADISGSNPFTAANAEHNATIEPGQTATFGFQASGSPGQPDVTGSICQ